MEIKVDVRAQLSFLIQIPWLCFGLPFYFFRVYILKVCLCSAPLKLFSSFQGP